MRFLNVVISLDSGKIQFCFIKYLSEFKVIYVTMAASGGHLWPMDIFLVKDVSKSIFLWIMQNVASISLVWYTASTAANL